MHMLMTAISNQDTRVRHAFHAINHQLELSASSFKGRTSPTTMPQIVHNPDALPTFPVFSQATISRGNVYVSGNIGCKPDLKTLVEGGVQAQTVCARRYSDWATV